MHIKFLGFIVFLLPFLGTFAYGADNNAKVVKAIVKYTAINGIDEEMLIEKTLDAPPIPTYNADLLIDIMKYADKDNTFDGEAAFLKVLALGKQTAANFSVLRTLVRCAKENSFDEDEYFERVLNAESLGKTRSLALKGILEGASSENNFDEEAAFDRVLGHQRKLTYHNANVLYYIAARAAFNNDIVEDDAFAKVLESPAIPINNAYVLRFLMIFANKEDTFDTGDAFERILARGQNDISIETADLLSNIAKYACKNDVDDDLIFAKALAKNPVPKEKVSLLKQIVESAKPNNGFNSEAVFLKLLNRE